MILKQPLIERDYSQQQQIDDNPQVQERQYNGHFDKNYHNNSENKQINKNSKYSNRNNFEQSLDSPIKRLRLSNPSSSRTINYNNNNNNYYNNNINNTNDNNNPSPTPSSSYQEIIPQIIRLAKDKTTRPLKQSYLSNTNTHTISTLHNNDNHMEQQILRRQQQQKKQSMSDPNQRRFIQLYKHQIKPKKQENDQNISKIQVQQCNSGGQNQEQGKQLDDDQNDDQNDMRSVEDDYYQKSQQQYSDRQENIYEKNNNIPFGHGLQSISQKLSQYISQPQQQQQQNQQPQQDNHNHFITTKDILDYSVNPQLKQNQILRHQFNHGVVNHKKYQGDSDKYHDSNIRTAQSTLLLPPNLSMRPQGQSKQKFQKQQQRQLIVPSIKNNYNNNKPLKTKPPPTNNKQRKLSYSISDFILSPRFQNYLSNFHNKQNQHINQLNQHLLQPPQSAPPKLLTKFNPNNSRRFGHNQYPQQPHLFYQSDTYPRCQPIKGSRESIIAKKQLQLSLANNLDKILFKYNGGHARVLYNNKLKIKNNSPVSVEVKILCTSPSHYDVRPISDIVLSPSEIMNFIIEMKLYLHDLDHVKMKHDLERYRGDMFKICYLPSQYSPDIWYQQGQKILPVVIEDSEQQKLRNESLLKDQSNDELKIAAGQKDIQMYRKMIGQNCLEMEQMEGEILQLEKKKFWTWCFNQTVLSVVGVVGFVIGYWIIG